MTSIKSIFRLHVVAAVLAGVCLVSGCVSSEGETTLSKAGFDTVRADTIAQIDALKKLTGDNIYVVNRNGRKFYVFADPPAGLIFVGNEAEFARYRKLRASQRSRNQEAELPIVENQSGLILGAWGAWRGWDA